MFKLKIEQQLKNLGLNSYEVKIWAALLSRGVSTAGELSDIATVPRSRSYDVLESLEKKGFVVIRGGKPIRYSAVTPKGAVEKARENIVKNAKEQINTLSNPTTSHITKELGNLYSKGFWGIGASELSGSLKGKNNLFNHIGSMLKRAEKSIFISTTQSEFINLIKEFKPLFEKLKRKNVNIKIVAQISKKTKKYANEMKQFAEIRHTDNKARFCIVDGKEIIFMVLDDTEVHPTYDVGIWVNTPLAKDLENIYLNQI